jgi:NAD(P)H-dependent FMN reductase
MPGVDATIPPALSDEFGSRATCSVRPVDESSKEETDMGPSAMIRIAIVIASVRPQRRGPVVAQWVLNRALERGDAEYELLDLADHPLPMLDEPIQAVKQKYAHEHTRAWSKVIAAYDGFVFVTPEYNHAPPASLKNAIDYLFHEWNDKAVTFVGYGAVGATRAIEQLRLIAIAVDMVPSKAQVAISAFSEFDGDDFTPAERTEAMLTHALNRLVARAHALRWLRLGGCTGDALEPSLIRASTIPVKRLQ